MGSSSHASKLRLLLSLLPARPAEFGDRLRAMLQVRWEARRVRAGNYQATDFAQVLDALGSTLGHRLAAFLDDSAVHELEAQLQDRAKRIRESSPLSALHDGDLVLGRLCYAVCRGLRPSVVVETGVAHGVTSAFVLTALAANAHGELHSIDLPPLGVDADRFVGALIPSACRSRWHLHRGASRRVLPGLLARIGPIDVFVHDSLHTEQNMGFELQSVLPHLRRPGVVISDDIEGNRAFERFASSSNPSYTAVLREAGKPGLCGVALLD
ncbi:MAG TPA: class I SAM-dependent methyltransferase [Polyangiales bacterium]